MAKEQKNKSKSETVKPKMYTLEEASKELVKKKEQEISQNEIRLQEFRRLIQEAQEKTGCYLIVNPESPLNNLQIIGIIRDE